MTAVDDFAAKIALGDANLTRLQEAVNAAPGTFTTSDGTLVENLRKRLQDVGFKVPVEHEAGLTPGDASFTVTYNGELYAANPAEIPFTTTGTFDPTKWVILFKQAFPTVAGLLASTDASRGVGSVWEGGSFRYIEADAGATDHDLTTAGGVKLYVTIGASGKYSFLPWGAVADGVTDDSAAIQAAIDAVTPKKGTIDGGGLTYYTGTTEFTAPQGVLTGSYGMNPAPKLHNCVFLTDVASGAFLKGYGWGGTPGGQYEGWHIHGNEIYGPGAGTATCIALSNARQAHVTMNKIRGFPGGDGIQIYSNGTGGSYGCVIFGNHIGYQDFVSDSGKTYVDITTQLLPNAVYNGVRVVGPGNSSGKSNDHNIDSNVMYATLGAAISYDWHGTFTGLGGSGNCRSYGNTLVGRMAKEIDEGTVISATSNTVTIPLPPAPVNQNSGDYDDCVFFIKAGTGSDTTPGDVLNRYYRVISDVVSGSERTLTVTPSFVTQPDATTNFEIIYGNNQLITDYGVGYFPTAIYYDSGYGNSSVEDYIEDYALPFVGGMNANDNFTFNPSENKGTDGRFGEIKSGLFVPRHAQSRGVDTNQIAPTNHIVSGTVLRQGISDPLLGDNGDVMLLTNDTGLDLSEGMVVRYGTGGAPLAKSTGSNGADMPFVVMDLSGRIFPDGVPVPVAKRGAVATTRVNMEVNETDTLVTGLNEYATVDNSQTDPKKILGYAMSATPGTGTIKAYIL